MLETLGLAPFPFGWEEKASAPDTKICVFLVIMSICIYIMYVMYTHIYLFRAHEYMFQIPKQSHHQMVRQESGRILSCLDTIHLGISYSLIAYRYKSI